MTLDVGTDIWYTGDQANMEGRGSIVSRCEDRWGVHLQIMMTDGRTFCVEPLLFEPHVGRRFMPWDEHVHLRQQEIANAQARYAAVITQRGGATS